MMHPYAPTSYLPPALARYDDIVTFAEERWLLSKGKPIQLEDHQKRILRHVFTKGPDGRFPYQTIIYSAPKKSGKTEVAALVGGWYGFTQEPDGEILVNANDLEQSTSRAWRAVRRVLRLWALEAGADLAIRTDRVVLPNGTTIQALPMDYAGASGANPTLTLWDETWAYVLERSRRMWEELAPSPVRQNSIRFVTSYAGFTGESKLLEDLYHIGMQGESVEELRDICNADGSPTCFANGDIFMYWDTVPRMPWQTPEYYESQRRIQRPTDFARQHENRWQEAEGAFIPPQRWAACYDPNLPELEAGEPIVLGVDAATFHDSFAVVGVTKHPLRPDDLAIRLVKVWNPKDQAGGFVDYDDPERFLRECIKLYSVAQVSYDSYQLEAMMQTFRAEGIAWCLSFAQGGDRLRADRALYDLILSGKIWHTGDAVLTEHIQNANARTQRDEDSTLRIVKRAEKLKIDACVAASMAAYRVGRLNLEAARRAPQPGTPAAAQDDRIHQYSHEYRRALENGTIAVVPPDLTSVIRRN